MKSISVLDVTPVEVNRDLCSGDLIAIWQLRNKTDRPLEVLETWLPHGGFFAERRPVEPPVQLLPDAVCHIQRTVRGASAAGVVENAFLNIRLRGTPNAEDVTRVLARMRVTTSAGLVTIEVEAVTSHQEGFAEAGTSGAQETHG